MAVVVPPAIAIAPATVVLMDYAGAKGERAEQQQGQGAEKQVLKHGRK
jgi:hypothetical protein